MERPGGRNGRSRRVLFVRTDAAVLDPRVRKETAALQRAGYHVRVLGWDRQSEYPVEERIDGVTFRRSRIPGPYGSKLLLFVLPLFWMRIWWEIARISPGAVHACDLDALIPCLVTKLALRHSLVYDIFDMFADKLPGVPSGVRALLASFDRRCMEWSDAVIMTDERRKASIGTPIGTPVEIVMNVPPDVPPPTGSRRGDVLRLCYAGSIHEFRGLRSIAEAVRDAEGIETTFAGWIPRAQDERFLRSQSHLVYLGKISFERSLQLVVDSDVVLALYDPAIPINMLASSNKVYEAMAAARPVITNNETAMADIVREHDCGLLVPYGSVQQLREAVLLLRDQPQLRARLGANGLRVFQERYRWSIMEQRLLALYASLPGADAGTTA